jgi:hypothetical protein
MPTFNDLINEVRSNLQGYTLRQDRLTYLANVNGINTTATEIQVGSANNLAKASSKLMTNLSGLTPLIRQQAQ